MITDLQKAVDDAGQIRGDSGEGFQENLNLHGQPKSRNKRRRRDVDFVTLRVRDECNDNARDITFQNRHFLEMEIGESLGNLQWLHDALQACD